MRDKIVTGALAVVLAVLGVAGGKAFVSAVVPGASGNAYAAVDVKEVEKGAQAVGGETQTADLKSVIPKIMNGVFYLVGILAVAMVVWGGVQYSLSGGDSGKVTNAKNTIVYGLVGMVIVIFSYAIVNFVLTQVTGK